MVLYVGGSCVASALEEGLRGDGRGGEDIRAIGVDSVGPKGGYSDCGVRKEVLMLTVNYGR